MSQQNQMSQQHQENKYNHEHNFQSQPRHTPVMSPHLFIYEAQISSLFSVFHRASGILLASSILFVTASVEFAANALSFYDAYSVAYTLESPLSWCVISFFLFLVFSFCYHSVNGIRHLIWDFFSVQTLSSQRVEKSAFVVLSLAVFLTLFFIFCL